MVLIPNIILPHHPISNTQRIEMKNSKKCIEDIIIESVMYVQRQTLLEYLIKKENKSKNVIKTIIQKGLVLVDGKAITKANFPISTSESIMIKPKPILYHDYEIPILYEDADLIVIDKPARLLTIATANEKELTAYHMISQYVNQKEHKKVFIIHRLDQETSGVLMFAKNEKIKISMQNNWNSIVRVRAYYALVEGMGLPPKGTIHTWLQETKTHLVYSSQNKTGKEAITHYQVLSEKENVTFLDIHLDTGRKNQIRVHMKELGHPVLGDSKYGDKNSFPRLALHAYCLEFIHPKTKKNISIKAEMPQSFHFYL